MLKGERILYKIANHYHLNIEHKENERQYSLFYKGFKVYPSFREALTDLYDLIMEETLSKKYNWLEEIWYIEKTCHLFD